MDQNLLCATLGDWVEMVKSARWIASAKESLSNFSPKQLISRSVAAVDRIEHIRESSSRFITSGQQIVACPIVAVSRGTGTI